MRGIRDKVFFISLRRIWVAENCAQKLGCALERWKLSDGWLKGTWSLLISEPMYSQLSPRVWTLNMSKSHQNYWTWRDAWVLGWWISWWCPLWTDGWWMRGSIPNAFKLYKTLYLEYIEVGSQKITGIDFPNLRYADNITLMAESKEELKEPLDESKRVKKLA